MNKSYRRRSGKLHREVRGGAGNTLVENDEGRAAGGA
jgi:hypothetical protein